MRDITLEDTIYMRFTTRAFATGIPTTLAGSPVVSVYEEDNLTQITSGVGLTVDYDSITGLNQVRVAAEAGKGYELGKSYDMVITTGTVDSVSVVGEVVGSFTIGSVKNAVDLAIGFAGVGLTHLAESSICTETRLSELDSGNLPNDIDSIVTGTITNAQGADVATDVAGMIDGNSRVDVGSWLGTAVTLGSGAPDVNIQSTDDIDLSSTQKASVATELETYDAVKRSEATSDKDEIMVRMGHAGVGLTHLAIASINTEARLSELDSGNMPSDIDAIPTTAMRGTDNAALASNVPDIISLANINAEVDTAIVTYGLDHLISASVTGTDVTDNSIIAKMVSANATADWDTFVNTTDSLQGIYDVNITLATSILADTGDILNDTETLNHTKIPQTLNLTASGNIGIDWANVENPTTALDLSATDIQLVDTVTTYTGNTVQTGDNYARLGVGGAGLTDLGGMSTAMKAEVNTEVDTALITTTYAEPGQGAPAATASIKDKLGYMYKFARNKITNDGNNVRVWDDAGTTIDQLSPVTSVGGTVTRGEFISG
jgi:hypothetical protein